MRVSKRQPRIPIGDREIFPECGLIKTENGSKFRRRIERSQIDPLRAAVVEELLAKHHIREIFHGIL